MSAISSGKLTRKLRCDLFEKTEDLSARQIEGIRVPILLPGSFCHELNQARFS